MFHSLRQAGYLDGNQPVSRLRKNFAPWVCAVLALVFFVSTFAPAIAALSTEQSAPVFVAHAEDDPDKDTKDEITKQGRAYVKSLGGQKDGADLSGEKAVSKSRKDWAKKNSFGYVFFRIFGNYYLNETPSASQGAAVNCDKSNPLAGTPLYHNCDVPNFMTEMKQMIISMLIGTSPTEGAETTSNYMSVPAFGLPNNIPDGGAPVDPAERTSKYTGLELFGYNLKYSRYYGEWDRIEVMTSARALQNFGFIDSIQLGAKAVFEGVASGVAQAGRNFVSGLDNGSLLQAVGGFFYGLFEGATTGVANTVLDTSDRNVFDTWAWYRRGYGDTAYNARELSDVEVAANARKTLLDRILETKPNAAKLPQDLVGISGGPEAPKEAIASCKVKTNSSGKMKDYRDSEKPPGPSEAECREHANDIAAANDFEAKYEWQVDGKQKAQTIEEWKKENESLFDTASKYGMDVDPESIEGKDDVKALMDRWQESYDAAATSTIDKEQGAENHRWMLTVLNKFIKITNAQKPAENYNAPWNRFVCVDENGKDIEDEKGFYQFVYNAKGALTAGCKPMRPPIQNGYYGNGYGSSAQPAKDTRYIQDGALFSRMFSLTELQNWNLNIAAFATRASNAVMSLAFSPILYTLGVTDLVVKSVSAFGDSIFFPLAIVLMGILGVQVLWRGVRGGGKSVFLNALSGIAIFALGVVFLTNPKPFIDAVDKGPAAVERAIAGSIFSVANGAEDELCTANDEDIVELENNTGLNGEQLKYNPHAGVRSMLCENWRTFAFNPWVFGQFGTNLGNLYSAQSNHANAWTNANKDLVGDAGVNMGGGTVMRNWAIYQLDKTSYGTASFDDPSKYGSGVNKDFFRIVDAQAGPNNGKDSYGKYFSSWSGQTGNRLAISFVGALVSVLGAYTVIVISFAKLQATFVATVMLIVAPLVFLMGIVGGRTRVKFKGFVATIIGLMIQRAAYVVLLSIMFRLLTATGLMSKTYLVCAMMTATLCIIFLHYRKDVEDMVTKGVEEGFGAPSMSSVAKNPIKTMQDAGIALPKYARNKVGNAKAALSGAAMGTTVGLLTGSGIKGSLRTSANSIKARRSREYNRQRSHGGFSAFESFGQASQAGRTAASRHLATDEFVKDAISDLRPYDREYSEFLKLEEEWKKLPAKENQDGEVVRYNPRTGKVVPKPTPPESLSLTSGKMKAKTARTLSKAAKRRHKAIARAERSGSLKNIGQRVEQARRQARGADGTISLDNMRDTHPDVVADEAKWQARVDVYAQEDSETQQMLIDAAHSRNIKYRKSARRRQMERDKFALQQHRKDAEAEGKRGQWWK